MSYASVVLADSPIVYYKLNENAANTTVADSSGNGHTATAVANTSTFASTSMLASGEGGSFTAASAGLASVAVDFSGISHAQATLEYWASFPNFTATVVPCEYTTAFDNGTNHGFATFFNTGNWYGGGYIIPGTSSFEFDLNSGSGGSGNPSTSAHHFVQVMDPTFSPNGSILLYIDGVLQSQHSLLASGSGTSGQYSNSGLYIGGRAVSSLFVPSGTKMSNVAVYPSLLSSTQVTTHYNASFPGPPPPPKVINNAPRIRSSYW
jgi:hypothetical protein